MDHVVDEFQNKKKLAKHCSRSLGSPALHAAPKAPSGVRGGGLGGRFLEQVSMLSLSPETQEEGEEEERKCAKENDGLAGKVSQAVLARSQEQPWEGRPLFPSGGAGGLG